VTTPVAERQLLWSRGWRCRTSPLPTFSSVIFNRSLPDGDHEIVVHIFLTHDPNINDPVPLGRLILEIAECQNNGLRLYDFEIHFDRLIVDVDCLKTMLKKVRQTMKTSKRYLRILLRIEKAMIVALRRDVVRAQEVEEEIMNETVRPLSCLPFCRRI